MREKRGKNAPSRFGLLLGLGILVVVAIVTALMSLVSNLGAPS